MRTQAKRKSTMASICAAFAAALAVGLAVETQAAWTLNDKSTILTDEETGWAFNVNAGFSFTSGETTYTGMAITSRKTQGTGTVVDLRNKALPEGVKLIGITGGCDSITELYLPDSVIYFGLRSLRNSTTLQKVEPLFSKTVKYVGQESFGGCTALEGDVVIEGGELLRNALQNCAKLTSVTLGKGITSVPTSAFSGCSGVTNVVMLGGVTSLASGSFSGLTSLREITFSSRPLMSSGNSPCFGDFVDYQMKMRVPEDTLENWKKDGKTVAFEAWDEASHRALYEASFPNDTETPIGLFTRLPKYNAYTKQWLFTYKPAVGENTKLTVTGLFSDATSRPKSGMTEYEPTAFPLACSCDRHVEELNGAKRTGNIYECYAGVIDRYVDAAWVNVSTNEGCAFSFRPAEPGTYRLTWLWRKAGYSMPKISFPPLPIATVTTNGTPSMGTWCLSGDVLTYTVAARGDGTFVRWYGDVPADQAFEKTVTVTVNKPNMTLTPFFTCPYWAYDANSKRLSDGSWELAVTPGTNPNELVIGKGSSTAVTHTPPVQERLMDLTKPITNKGVRVVGFATRSFTKYNNEDMEAREIRLPKGFASIAANAFYSNSGRTTNIVFRSFPTIHADAFPVNRGQMLWQVPANNAGWQAFVADPTKFIPWNDCDVTTQKLWKAGAPYPAGVTTGFNNQFLRIYSDAGLTVLIR